MKCATPVGDCESHILKYEVLGMDKRNSNKGKKVHSRAKTPHIKCVSMSTDPLKAGNRAS